MMECMFCALQLYEVKKTYIVVQGRDAALGSAGGERGAYL